MEMLERCPGCSVAREVETKVGPGQSSPRPCSHCGYDGPFLAVDVPAVAAPAVAAPAVAAAAVEEPARADSPGSFAGARAKLATATQDLFRLSGSYSLPADKPAEPPPVSAPASAPLADSRKESSIMFSLEALMRANTPPPKPADDDEVRSELWSLQAATPLFGTAHDQALLTTPLKMSPAPSMDSMTLPTQQPGGRRWLPALLAACAGLALTAGGLWVYGPFGGPAPVNAATSGPEQASLAAEPPPAEPPPAGEPALAEAAPAEPVPSTEAQLAEAESAAVAEPGEGASGASESAAGGAEAEAEEAEPEAEGKERSRRVASAARKPAPRRAAPSRKKPAAFDKDAARSALASAAAGAAGCRQGGAPGSGKIQVTFAPSGRVTNARLVDSSFSGAAASGCVLRHFRAAKVPAFSGGSVTVAKSFRID